MFRYALFLTFLAVPMAFSAPADFSKGALNFSLRYGGGSLTLDKAFGDENAYFPAPSRGAQSVGLSLGYNIMGHASLAADVLASGWNLRDSERGGGGFAGFMAYWHPLSSLWKASDRPVPFELQVGLGAAYALVAQRRIYNLVLVQVEDNFAFEGWAFQTGLEASYYFTPFVGLGLYARGVFIDWDKNYQNLEKNVFTSVPEGRGGQFWSGGVSLLLRFET